MYVSSGETWLSRCSFESNEAVHGAACAINRPKVLIFQNGLFANNDSSNYGGVIYQVGGWGIPTDFVNCTFASNHAGNDGHIFYNTDGASALNFSNCLLWNGTADVSHGKILNLQNGTANFSYCYQQGVDLTGVGTGNIDGTLSEYAPVFTAENAGYYGMHYTSRLINAGSLNLNTSVTELDLNDEDGDLNTHEIFPYDFNNKERVQLGAVDIGYLESSLFLNVPHLIEFESGDINNPLTVSDFNHLIAEGNYSITAISDNTDAVTVSTANGLLEVTPVEYGSATLTITSQLESETPRVLTSVVNVNVTPLEERDLSALVGPTYESDQFGQSQTYFDLSTLFADGPESFNAYSEDSSVFTASESNGIVSITPLKVGKANLVMEVSYAGGTVLTVNREVWVKPISLDERDFSLVTDQTIDSFKVQQSVFFADLSIPFSDGPDSFVLTTGDSDIATFSMNGDAASLDINGVGTTFLRIQAHYADGTVLETTRALMVTLVPIGEREVAQLIHPTFTLSGMGVPQTYADLTIPFPDFPVHLYMHSTNESLFTVDVVGGVGSITPLSVGQANVHIVAVYYNGDVINVARTVTVEALPPIVERDLSLLVDASFYTNTIGTHQTYLDLNTVFTDNPISFDLSSSDTNIFTASENAGAVTVVPQGVGAGVLTIDIHYPGGQSLQVQRNGDSASDSCWAARSE